MLLQRLKDHRSMGDGVIWSAQSDFIARLAEWEKNADVLWSLLRVERSDLLVLNVPHFISTCDGDETSDATGFTIRHDVELGLDRARKRFETFDENEINWQVQVIKENTRACQSRQQNGGERHSEFSGAFGCRFRADASDFHSRS